VVVDDVVVVNRVVDELEEVEVDNRVVDVDDVVVVKRVVEELEEVEVGNTVLDEEVVVGMIEDEVDEVVVDI
jgi:hypothetical protein